MGADKEAALNLLGEIYNADREIQKARIESLKATRSEIQKLISATEEQLRNFSERDLIRKNFVDSVLAVNKNITEEQLVQLMNLFDIATGDFARWMKENNVSYVVTKEEQLKTEKRLMQMVTEKTNTITKEFRALATNSEEGPAKFFVLPLADLYDAAFTIQQFRFTDEIVETLETIKSGKYDIQDALFEDMTLGLEDTLQILDQTIQYSVLKEDSIFYRGLPAESPLTASLIDAKPGMIIQSKGYLSITPNRGVAQSFGFESE